MQQAQLYDDQKVSIHVPLAEHDVLSCFCFLLLRFQFTCPSRSTTILISLLSYSLNVSIHVPLAEHDDGDADIVRSLVVSIHVPLAEHDRC